ncbi:MAG: NAD-dependent epimerase/dehydratase family protein [Crocinitomicaceae bacterium]|nr:NAD-dependent epimerase/dehydratase family protein [Crocinitomicaceae bacterium]
MTKHPSDPVSLVTGGAGFIGSHVVDELLKLGHRVVILDDLSGGLESNFSSEASFFLGSITDEKLVDELFERFKFDYVYHLAAYAAEGLSHFIRRFNYENNLLGSANLINASVNHEVKCFVFTSSIAVYGDITPPMSEETPPSPIDPYGIAKFAVELDLKSARALFGLNSIVFRPHNVYGSRQNIGDKYRNVAGIFMNQLLKGEDLTIFGDGNQSRAFTHIHDVAPHIAISVENEDAYNQSFNIGSDEVHSVNELAAAIADVMDKTLTINHLEQREEAEHAYSDHSKFNSTFKSEESTSLVDGLREMYSWVKEHGSKESPSFGNIEIEKNLPNSWKTQQ